MRTAATLVTAAALLAWGLLRWAGAVEQRLYVDES